MILIEMKVTQSIKDRFSYLRGLELGWFYADTPGLNQMGLEELEEWFLGNYDFEALPLPHIYPTPAGGVQFEVEVNNGNVIELIADLDTLLGEMTLIGGDAVETETISLKDRIGWRRFNEAVKYGL